MIRFNDALHLKFIILEYILFKIEDMNINHDLQEYH